MKRPRKKGRMKGRKERKRRKEAGGSRRIKQNTKIKGKRKSEKGLRKTNERRKVNICNVKLS